MRLHLLLGECRKRRQGRPEPERTLGERPQAGSEGSGEMTWCKTLTEAEWKRVVFERLDRQQLQKSLAQSERDVSKLRAVVKALSPRHAVLAETFDPDDDGDEAA